MFKLTPNNEDPNHFWSFLVNVNSSAKEEYPPFINVFNVGSALLFSNFSNNSLETLSFSAIL